MALFHCEACGIRKDVPDKFAGTKVRCSSCRQAVLVTPTPEPALAAHSGEFKRTGMSGTHAPRANAAGHTLPERDIAKEQAEGEDLLASLQIQDAETPPSVPSHATKERTATSGTASDMASGTTSGASSGASGQSVDFAPRQTRNRLPLLHGGIAGNVLGGLEGGLLLIFFCLTFAMLIHEAAPGLCSADLVFGMALTSATVFCIVMSVRGRLPVLAAGPETATCSLLFLFALFLHGQTDSLSPEQASATLIAGMVITALLTGMAAQLAARMDAGRVLRFIPQPVIGGLLAAVGLVLLQGAYKITAADPFCLAGIAPAFSSGQCLKWLPALGLGVVLLLFVYRSKNALLKILLLALSIGAAHGMYIFSGTDILSAQDTGTLLSPVSPALPWHVLHAGLITDIQWPVLLEGLPYLAAAMVLVILSLADKVYTLELLLEDDVDLNDLLRSLAMSNTISAMLGGLPGSISVNRSMGADSARKRGPLAGVVAGLLCGSALLWAGPLAGYIPRFVPAGLLVFFGFALLRKWLVDTKRQFTRMDDYVLLVIIFFTAAVFGILAGMAAAFLLSILVLAHRYSKSTVIKHLLPGSTHRSRVDRSANHLAMLRTRGNEILMMRLQGFIFLGSTTPIIAAIRNRLRDDALPSLRYLILDFSLVNGLAAQVAISFTQLKQLAAKNGFLLIFTNVPFEVEQQLESAGYALNEADGSSISFVDMDYALEWCEDRILSEEGMDDEEDKSLTDMLSPLFPEPDKLSRLMPFLERMEFRNKEVVFRQGDTADAMYFIESGMVNIQLELGARKTTRLKKMGPGTVFGEMGIYTHAPRSASAVAAGKCVLYRLSQSTLDRMQHSDPQLLSAIHRFIVHLLSQRVNDANFRVMDLLR